jgi:hypothetical protein
MQSSISFPVSARAKTVQRMFPVAVLKLYLGAPTAAATEMNINARTAATKTLLMVSEPYTGRT